VSLVSFLDLSYSNKVDDTVYNSMFHICAFIPTLGCICIYVYCPARCWQPKVLMEEISLWVSVGRPHVPVLCILGSMAWQWRRRLRVEERGSKEELVGVVGVES